MIMTNEIKAAPALTQDDFNRLARGNGFSFRWDIDSDSDSKLDAHELAISDMTLSQAQAKQELKKYVTTQKGQSLFTGIFLQVYEELREAKRREVATESYHESQEIHIRVDMTDLAPDERKMVEHIANAAHLINDLYHEQLGTKKFDAQAEAIRSEHSDSYLLYQRNHGPNCEAPKTADDPFCSALPGFPKPHLGIYPETKEINDAFCATLTGDLVDPMTVVADDGQGGLKAIYYQDYYRSQMAAVAAELDLAADAITNNQEEKALYAYLRTAAESFRTGNWLESDRQWVAMNMNNSKYALRVAPDETYWEPCQSKAGFELWFGKINKEAVKTIDLFKPLKDEMMAELVALTPYVKFQDVKFNIPDIVDIAIFAGDARNPRGGILGQMLPNYSYQEVGLRQLIMQGYDTDPRVREMAQEKAKLILHPETLAVYTANPDVGTFNATSHELTHSFPVGGTQTQIYDPQSRQAKTHPDGKPMTVKDALGGQLSTGIEELRAETGTLFWIGWLAAQGKVSQVLAQDAYASQLLWAINHVSQGMTDPVSGTPDTYSRLAGAQIRYFLSHGALEFIDGKFKMNFSLYPQVTRAFLKEVIDIQLTGDKQRADELMNGVAEGTEGYVQIHADEIRKKYAVFPQNANIFEPIL
jgi:hypothetical protein